MGYGGIGFDENSLGSGIVDKVEQRVADMGERLIDHRGDAAIAQQLSKSARSKLETPIARTLPTA